MDPTKFVTVKSPGACRKRVVNKNNWKRYREKQERYKQKQLPQFPTCGHNTKSYQCSFLTMRDIKTFSDTFHANSNKIVQDSILLKFCSIGSTQRIRNPLSTRNRSVAISCFVRTENKGLLPVCKAAFLGILNISKHRIDGENRGGDHVSFKNEHKKEAVIEFVKRLAIIEKHYCRRLSNREYVSSYLTIAKLWRMYSAEHNELPVKQSYFRQVFNTNFNIGFNSTQTDVCSTCLELRNKIKHSKNDTEKSELSTRLKVHKLRARAFFDHLKEERADLLTISFDCQKNLVLPKIPDQITYYKRQFYIYKFTVVVGSSKSKLCNNNVFVHTWFEHESQKSSNEIVSAVYDCLSKIEISDQIREIRLIADGCTGQNKNSCMLAMACKWFSQSPKKIDKIQLVFPVTGHSFLPADRVFAQIEKKIRKQDTITDPTDYINIFRAHGTVKKIGKDWSLLDWRSAIKDVMKPTNGLHFQLLACKRFILTKQNTKNILVQGELNYKSETGVAKSIFRRGKTVHMLSPQPLEVGKRPIKKLKKDNVDELLSKHFGAEIIKKF
nr:unnamed protein product [Callosobruchus chinensis]